MKNDNMMLLNYRLLYFCLFLFCAGPLFAHKNFDESKFLDEDTVCFLGNSITEGGAYHTFINLFYLTRFPEKNIHIINCGIAGNRADQGIARLQTDVLIHNPDVVTVMFGMNDVGSTIYSKSPTREDIQKQKEVITTYRHNMDSLSALLKIAGVRIIYFTPTIYDQVAKFEKRNDYGKNQALSKCRDIIFDLAKKYNSPVVDIYSAMEKINKEHQAMDSMFSIVGPDRVHPGEEGHLVMAYEFLKAQGISTVVSEISIDAKKSMVTSKKNCELYSIRGNDDKLSFTMKSNALPFPVNEYRAINWVPVMNELNQELLVVKNLHPGTYALFIDEEKIGEFSHQSFSQGINLAGYFSTPQYQQALMVKELNKWRAQLVKRRIRSLAMFENDYFPDFPDGQSLDSIADYFTNHLENLSVKRHYNYLKRQTEKYLLYKQIQKETLKEIQHLNHILHLINQPVIHKYDIVKL